jgi:hypothetical protein
MGGRPREGRTPERWEDDREKGGHLRVEGRPREGRTPERWEDALEKGGLLRDGRSPKRREDT